MHSSYLLKHAPNISLKLGFFFFRESETAEFQRFLVTSMSKGPKWNDETQNTITVWIWEKGINIYVKLIGKQTSFCLEIELIISGLGLMHHPNIHSGCSFSFVFQELFLNLISNSSIHSANTKLNLIVLHVVGLVQEIWCPGFYFV